MQKENGCTLPVSIAAIAAVPAGSTTRPRLNNTATVALISSSLTNMIPLTNFRIWLKAFLPAKGGASPEAILRASGHSTAYPSYNNHIACWLGCTYVCKIIVYTLINLYPNQPISTIPSLIGTCHSPFLARLRIHVYAQRFSCVYKMQHLPTSHLHHSKPRVYQEIDLVRFFGSLPRYQHRGCHIQKLNEGHQMGVEK